MNKRCIFTAFILFFFLPIQSSYQDTVVYIAEGNIFDGLFKEPFEIAYVLMEDGHVFSFSVHLECTVGIGAGYIRNHLKSRGYKVSQIVIVMHNHSKLPTLSFADIAVYKELVRMGFTGSFGVYHEPSRKVILYREKEAN